MAFPTAVNSQITDSVTQANVKVLGEAPAMAMGALYQSTAQALSNAAHNATTAQQQAMVTSQAATTQGVMLLYGVDTASTAAGIMNILQQSKTKPVAAEAVVGETIIGHIRSSLDSPQGKREVQQAVEQANASRKAVPDPEVLNEAQTAISEAISAALQKGLSRQSVCYVLNQVAHDRGISLLYPFDTSEKRIKAKHIQAYYSAIIKAYRREQA